MWSHEKAVNWDHVKTVCQVVTAVLHLETEKWKLVYVHTLLLPPEEELSGLITDGEIKCFS